MRLFRFNFFFSLEHHPDFCFLIIGIESENLNTTTTTTTTMTQKINEIIKITKNINDGSGTIIKCSKYYFCYVCEYCYYFKMCNQLGTPKCIKYKSNNNDHEMIEVQP